MSKILYTTKKPNHRYKVRFRSGVMSSHRFLTIAIIDCRLCQYMFPDLGPFSVVDSWVDEEAPA